MATEILDLRRPDQYEVYHNTPFWMESAPVTKEADDKASILFSFPTAVGKKVIVHDIAVKIVTAFAGGTVTLNVGAHTIATDAAVTGDTATLVDADDYVPTASITNGTAGVYLPAAGDFVTAKAAGTNVAPQVITPADATVPCISAELASSATITAGEARVFVLVSVIP